MLNHIIYGKTSKSVELELIESSLRNKIDHLENEVRKLPQVSFNPKHVFKEGIFERTITIPKGGVVVGAKHITDYKVRLESGTIQVLTDDGMKVLTGPVELFSKAGMKRVGFALTDVVWTDIYDNTDNCTDLDILIPRLTNVEHKDLVENRIVLESQQDWPLFIENSGWTEKQIDLMVKNNDLIAISEFQCDYELKKSPIHGIGMFAKRCFEEGETLFPARIGDNRTDAGRFINHSPHANVKLIKLDNDDLMVIAIRRIMDGEELLLNYRQAIMVNIGRVIL